MFETNEQLKEAIKLYCSNKDKCIEQYGEPNNWDVSKITDMSYMFYLSEFNDDISNWDVSNVTKMNHMFYHSKFNGDISDWDVSNVKNMKHMFNNSQFKGDISKWNISNVIYGKEEILKLGAKKIKIIESIKEGYEECPVTKEIIKGDYIKCKTCNKCFDIVVKEWIKNNKSCPYCRSKWNKIQIYSQR